jgi:hypothetical protein
MRLTVLLLISCGLLLAPLPSRVSATANRVEVLGNFSNVRRAGEDDALGYTLRLWKEGNKLFGLFAAYVGPPADPPVGILEDVKFDPRTRQLSFSARLSTGVVSGQGYDHVASRDRFVFKGVLTRREVRGTLQQSNDLFPNRRPDPEKISLRHSQFLTELMMPPPSTYAEWKTWADEVLQRSGPKW